MLPIIVGGAVLAGTIAAGLYAYFSVEANNARVKYNLEAERYYTTIEELRNEVKVKKIEALTAYNPFNLLIPIYIGSVKAGDMAHRAVQNLNSQIFFINYNINETKIEMANLYASIPKEVFYSKRDKIHKNIGGLKFFKQTLYSERNTLFEEKNRFMLKREQFNNETHDLKIYIRDNCGKGGYLWYQHKEGKYR